MLVSVTMFSKLVRQTLASRDVSAPGSPFRILDGTCCYRLSDLCSHIGYFTGEFQGSRLIVFAALGAVDKPLPPVCWSTFLEIRCTRTYLSDATAVPVVTSSGDESFKFSSIYTFMFNSSRKFSLNWRHIIMSLQHPVYYCFVNNILKHDGDILHICDDIVMWFWWLSVTGVKQCTSHWLISSELV